MKDKTMIKIAYEALQNKEKMTLKQIMTAVSKELKPTWKTERPNLSVEEITNIKLGELHKLLTISGLFLRLKDSSWTLIEKYSPEEIKALKLQVQEQLN